MAAICGNCGGHPSTKHEQGREHWENYGAPELDEYLDEEGRLIETKKPAETARRARRVALLQRCRAYADRLIKVAEKKGLEPIPENGLLRPDRLASAGLSLEQLTKWKGLLPNFDIERVTEEMVVASEAEVGILPTFAKRKRVDEEL